ncbi:GNAT family N-acetyltransferase [Cetobacterium sp. SF1]|uniref:GNAT family N-acetyltransferase n=1 Tax=unclassified Cetobacterium TaxID=2630983 RepID=UPI003CF69880
MQYKIKKLIFESEKNILSFYKEVNQNENGFFIESPEEFENFQDFIFHFKNKEDTFSFTEIPEEIFCLILKNKIIGLLKIRTRLNNDFFFKGGHLSYYIHPNFRNQGYGNIIFQYGLSLLKKRELNRILVTVLKNNYSSIKIIENFNGILFENNDFFYKYWINI